jgi:endo-1,4-beta-D-glucanase Y
MEIEPNSYTLFVRTVTKIKDDFTLVLNSTQNAFVYAAMLQQWEPTEKLSW